MPTPARARRASVATNRNSDSVFELDVLPRDDIGYGLALFRSATPASDGREGRELLVRIWGIPAAQHRGPRAGGNPARRLPDHRPQANPPGAVSTE